MSSGAGFFGFWRNGWTSSEPVTGPGSGRGRRGEQSLGHASDSALS